MLDVIEMLFTWITSCPTWTSEKLKFVCPGAPAILAASQLGAGLYVIVLMHSTNIKSMMNRLFCDAADVPIMIPLAAGVKCIILWGFEMMLGAGGTYVLMFRTLNRASCTFGGDVFVTVAAYIFLWLVGLSVLVLSPEFFLCGKMARFNCENSSRDIDMPRQTLCGNLRLYARRTLRTVKHLLCATVGYWPQPLLELAIEDVRIQKLHPSCPRTCEFAMFLMADFFSLAYHVLPMGAIPSKVMQSVNKGFVWGNWSSSISPQSVAPTRIVKIEKMCAWIRAAFIIWIPVLNDAQLICFGLAILVIFLGCVCESLNRKCRPEFNRNNLSSAPDVEDKFRFLVAVKQFYTVLCVDFLCVRRVLWFCSHSKSQDADRRTDNGPRADVVGKVNPTEFKKSDAGMQALIISGPLDFPYICQDSSLRLGHPCLL